MIKVVYQLISISIIASSCVSDPDTHGEMNLRSGEVIHSDMPAIAPVEHTGRKKREPLVVKVYVHPRRTESVINEGHYIHVKVDDGHWLDDGGVK